MGDRIKQLRLDLGMSQLTFADKLGITTSAVGMYEVGKRSPSSGVVALICKTFGVNEAWLRTGEGSMFTDDARLIAVKNAIDEVFADEDAEFRRRWFEMSCNLTDEQWRVLQQIAVELVKQNDDLSEEAKELIRQAEAAEEEGA